MVHDLVTWSEVKLHVLSHGLHYASCVFEGERVYDGSIFKLEEHTQDYFILQKKVLKFYEAEINSACKNYFNSKVENGYVRPVA